MIFVKNHKPIYSKIRKIRRDEKWPDDRDEPKGFVLIKKDEQNRKALNI
jgi:hypothetical protein